MARFLGVLMEQKMNINTLPSKQLATSAVAPVRRLVGSRCLGWTMLGCAILAVPLPPLASEPSRDEDWQLTFRARQLLQSDQSLNPLNLGVIVRGRVAVLWGPVPSTAQARRAVERLQTLSGLHGVRSELQIEPSREGGSQPPPRSPKADRQTSASNKLPVVVSIDSRARSAIEEYQPERRIPVTTMSPTPTQQISALVHRTPILAPARPNLEQTIRRLQLTDPRFRSVRINVRQGLVYLQASSRYSDELFQVAEVISELPGVERVIVKEALGR
jgi:hypothetical protein